MRCALTWLVPLLLLPGIVQAGGQKPIADATTRLLLRRAEFEQIQISPDGKLLAIARRLPGGTVVTIHQRESMTPTTTIDPGKNGEVDTLRWLDNQRLLVGANRADGLFGMAMVDPALYIVNANGSGLFKLPANFVATIDGDPDHLLVSACGTGVESGCVAEIRRADINKLRRVGELVVAAPSTHTRLYVDHQGAARFALRTDDDGTSKTYIHTGGKETWTLFNDGAKTGLDTVPLGVSRDNKTGYLISERRAGANAIETYDFATGARAELFQHPGSDPISVLHSVDGKEPIGAIYNATRPEIRVWNGRREDAVLVAELQKTFPGKLAHVVSATADGMTTIVHAAADRDAGAFYLYDRKARKIGLLTKRKPWLDQVPLATQQAIELKARDGQPLQGLLTLPLGTTGKPGPLPMVVLVHGGPYGVFDHWGYDPETQILATHGYAVLQVNFRGSGGYGRDFMERGLKQWGRAMQDDVTDATKWAIAAGIADAGRICIYGASFGGYAAMMGAIREPALYRCAAGLAGVFDLAKMYKWGSIRRSELGMEYLKRAIGEDQVDLASRSPAKLADQLKVPVLLAHGRLDARVDVKHARALRKAVEASGGNVDLVEYPYAGHGLVLEDQQQDFYARLLAFLDRNLDPSSAATASNP